MSDETLADRQFRMLRGAAEELAERLKTFTDLVRSTSGAAVGAVAGPVPTAAADVLSSLRGLVEQAPPPTAAIDLLYEEVQAKRAMVQALQVQLESFDSQLGILEKSLQPLHAWGRQWASLQSALSDALPFAPGRSSDGTT